MNTVLIYKQLLYISTVVGINGHTEQKKTFTTVKNIITPLPDMMLFFNDHCPSLTTVEHLFENREKEKAVSAS